MKKVARLPIVLLALAVISTSVYALADRGEAQEPSPTPEAAFTRTATPGPPPPPEPPTREWELITPQPGPQFPPFPTKVAFVVNGRLQTGWGESLGGLTLVAFVEPTAGWVPGRPEPDVPEPGKCGQTVLSADGSFRLEVLSGTGKEGCYDLEENNRVRVDTITAKGSCYVELPYVQRQEFLVSDVPPTLRSTPLEIDAGTLTCPLAQGVPTGGRPAPEALPDTGGGGLLPAEAPAQAPVMGWVKPTDSDSTRTLYLKYHFDGACPSKFYGPLGDAVGYWNGKLGYEAIHVVGSCDGTCSYDLCVDDVPYDMQGNTIWDCSGARPIDGPDAHAHGITWVYGFDTNKMVWAAEELCGSSWSSSYLSYLFRHELGHIFSLADVSTCPGSNKPLMNNQYEYTYCSQTLNTDEWGTVQDYWVDGPAGVPTNVRFFRSAPYRLGVYFTDNSTTDARFAHRWYRWNGSAWQQIGDKTFKGNDGQTGTWDGAGDTGNQIQCAAGTTYDYGAYVWPKSFTGNYGTNSVWHQETRYCY